MRPLFAVLSLAVLATAAPACAQIASSYEVDLLRMQQEAAQRQAVARANELMALEARLQTEQAVADLRQQRQGVRLPELPYTPPLHDTAPVATPKYPSVPDAILADSNRKVREASTPRR